MPNDETRPITLFVSRIAHDVPDLEYMKAPRVTVIDVEMDVHTAKALMKQLDEWTKAHIAGSIRYRMYGNLVLG